MKCSTQTLYFCEKWVRDYVIRAYTNMRLYRKHGSFKQHLLVVVTRGKIAQKFNVIPISKYGLLCHPDGVF